MYERFSKSKIILETFYGILGKFKRKFVKIVREFCKEILR